MAISTNLPINDMDATKKYFEQVYDQPIEFSQNVVDALYAFFIARTDNKETALALVSTTLVTALEARVDPMEMLDKFEGLDDFVLDSQLALFLNISRTPTSMLGVQNIPTVNKHISRTILS